MTKSILVTGASGKTGKTIISAFAKHGFSVTAFTHKAEYINELISLGANDVRIGDLRSQTDLDSALDQKDAIYHICPNMTPDEYIIGKDIIHLCEKKSVRRFLYHSVLHPQISQMPHHWQKMQVEEELFSSSLEYTILQPTAYLQNILAYKSSIMGGIYPMPYSTTARISMVDLRDVAFAAVKMLKDPSTIFGIYELVGTEAYSQIEIAEKLSTHLNIHVEAHEVDKKEWEANARKNNLPDYSRETLLAMFRYYDKNGLKGSPLSLTFLLGRKPITIEEYLKDEFINSTQS